MKKIFLAVFSLLSVSMVACNSDKGMVSAVVMNSGDLSPEGCGYVLRINDSAMLKSINLPSAYQHNGLRVKVEYNFTGQKDTCDFGPKIFDLVNIIKIKKEL